MRTKNILIATIMVMMTASTFAQGKRDPFVTVKYSAELNRFETWVSKIHDRLGYYTQKETDLPVIFQTYYSDYTNIFYENEPFLESWMTVPFMESFSEDGLIMETWMSQLFETDELSEELIPIEVWMTASNWQ